MFGSHQHLEKKLRKDGKSAPGQVLNVEQTHMAITHGNPALVANTEVVIKVKVQVSPNGEAPFEFDTTTRVSQFGGLSVGDAVAVLYDPSDHTKAVIDEEATQAASQAAMDNLDAQVRQIAAGALPGTVVTPGSAPNVSKLTAADILAQGDPVRVVIVQSAPLGMKNPQGVDLYGFVLSVLHDGSIPTEAHVGNPVPQNCVAMLFPGNNLPAKVLADNPQAVAIDWDGAIAAYTASH